MEIDKIAFENLRTLGITSDFDELDINVDGKITKEDLSLTKDNKLSGQIMEMLDMADDDAELLSNDLTADSTSQVANTDDTVSMPVRSGSKKKADNKVELISKNACCYEHVSNTEFDEILKNTKGTVYLVMGNATNCGTCISFEKYLKKYKSQLDNVASCYNIQWHAYNDYCWSLLKKANGGQTPSNVNFPIVLKFVDGKLQQGYQHPVIGFETKEIKKMISGAQNTSTSNTTQNTAENKTADSTTAATKSDNEKSTAKTAADIKTAADNLAKKYPASAPAEGVDKYSTNNPQLVALKNAIADGAISNLANEGFSQEDIVDIISQAFPNLAIKRNAKGGYTCPKGHGADAKEIYTSFIDELSKVASAEVLALQAEVKALNEQILTNNTKLDILKASIESLKKELETLIEKAIEESEEIAEEQKAEAKKIVNEELDKYSSANGEMTYEEFQNALSGRLDTLSGESNSKLSSVLSKMLNAESKMTVLNGYLTTFSSLIDANKSLSEKVNVKTDEVEKAQEECKNNCENVKRCDPIGFSANGVKYDFFVDKDGNGEITNETEFLGATGGWDEMVALDKDGDGSVSVSEMSNIKVVVTAQDGTQSVKNVSDLFAQTDSVDINSYKAMNKDFSNGNTLLGTFSMTFNGEKIDDAYNTMDKLSWLDEKYNFSDEENGVGRFAQGNTEYETATDYSKELEVFKLDYEKMEVKLGSAWSKLGITRSDLSYQLGSAIEKEAERKASAIEDKIEQNKAKEAQEAEEAKKKLEEEDCPECTVKEI